MTIFRCAAVFALLGVLSGCGGVDLTCDDVRTYQLAEEGKRIEVPEDLDELDPLKEAPLPDTSVSEERAPGAACIDRPPPAAIGK